MKLKLSHVQVLELYDSISPKVANLNSTAKLSHPLGEIHNKLRQYIISALDNTAVKESAKQNEELFPRWVDLQNKKMNVEQEQEHEKIAPPAPRKMHTVEPKFSSKLLNEIMHDNDDEITEFFDTTQKRRPPPPVMKLHKRWGR